MSRGPRFVIRRVEAAVTTAAVAAALVGTVGVDVANATPHSCKRKGGFPPTGYLRVDGLTCFSAIRMVDRADDVYDVAFILGHRADRNGWRGTARYSWRMRGWALDPSGDGTELQRHFDCRAALWAERTMTVETVTCHDFRGDAFWHRWTFARD